MNTAAEILERTIPDASDNFDANYKEDCITAMHEFANQFKSWIPVSEKLPPDDMEVICFATGDQFFVTYTDGTWLCDDYNVEFVTHWHYLLQNPA